MTTGTSTSTTSIPNSFRTACGGNINVSGDARKHLKAHPEAGPLLAEAIAKITLPEDSFLLIEVKFDRMIGQRSCVPIDPEAPAQFAIRIGRDMPTRVVLGARKLDAKSFVICAFKKGEAWNLITGYVGEKALREPHDRHFMDPSNAAEFKEALIFWNTHALVWEPEVMGEVYVSTWEAELKKHGRGPRAVVVR